MADQHNVMDVMACSSQESSNDQKVDNILHVNDDCLLAIFKYFSPIELCSLSETCKRFQYVACFAYKYRYKNKYAIPKFDIMFVDHARILRNFGHLINDVLVSTLPLLEENFLSPSKMETAFDGLERYCAETINALSIYYQDNKAMPPSALRLSARAKKLRICSALPFPNALELLQGCTALVELDMAYPGGPFHIFGLNFPHLQKLNYHVWIWDKIQFSLVERFFGNHSQITDLKIQFDVNFSYRGSVILSFLRNLINLEKLQLTTNGSRISHPEALSNLEKLKQLAFDQTQENEMDVAMLENISPLRLEKLELGFSQIDHLINGIENLNSLTHLTITHDMLPFLHLFNTNISGLSQLKNSRLIYLRVSCERLLKPEAIVPVVRNLRALKDIIFWCIVDLTESICRQLVAVCSLQRRKVDITICEELMDIDDFTYIDKFNEKYGHLVRIHKQ